MASVDANEVKSHLSMLPAPTQLFWGLRTCSSWLSKAGLGCTLLVQSPWWQWDRDVQPPLLARHWGMESIHWAAIVSNRLHLLPLLPFFPLHCLTQWGPPGKSLGR